MMFFSFFFLAIFHLLSSNNIGSFVHKKKKKIPSGTISRSRNFSLSSERFLVEQINKSLNGNLAELNRTNNESMETEGSQPVGSDEMETCDCTDGVEKRNYPIMPTEDDIEKSFRVNEDGSMTVEMKVHLTIKQEEMIHWTTTLSRISVNNQQMIMIAYWIFHHPGSWNLGTS